MNWSDGGKNKSEPQAYEQRASEHQASMDLILFYEKGRFPEIENVTTFALTL